jgi:hypothetical protein
LVKNDSIQQSTAQLNKVGLFIAMCDQYPIAYDILWTLSFNVDIQQQLRSTPQFMSKLVALAKDSPDESMRKITNGILWNLESDHDRIVPSSGNNDDDASSHSTHFDMMISYSHKEKVMCQQLYEHLTKKGYRVWIDFDQMHGNVMDAMADAIEHSETIIICMSEQYRRSNFCRAEAQYAFQRQRKIVPVLLQKHYKPDGWLLFLIGQLLYVDFTKYEFSRAMDMLLKELHTRDESAKFVAPASVSLPASSQSALLSPETSSNSKPPTESSFESGNMLEWTREQVQRWLIAHELQQMSRLLSQCDGRSLVYLHRYMKYGQVSEIVRLVEGDATRRLKESLSIVELCRFQALMDEERRTATPASVSQGQTGKGTNLDR